MRFARRKKLPRDLFETRSHAWESLGIGDELLPKTPRRGFAGLLAAIVVLAATLFIYGHRHQIAPGHGQQVRFATVAVLIVVGLAAAHWLGQALTPRLSRRLDPATAGTVGFLFRLTTMILVVVVALRIAGVNTAALA